MRRRFISMSVLAQLVWLLPALWAPGASADPGSFPRGTVDQTFTATRSNTPTGLGFSARYHAAGDESGNPPYMRRMVFHPPPGMRYDTTVPEACTASDFELSFRGPAACPPGSRLGEGSTEGVFTAPGAEQVVLDNFIHHIDVFNNVGEQLILVETEQEGWAVVRGRFLPDGSLVFESPTCFPTPPTGCVDDHVLQTATQSFVPAYTRTVGGTTLSYATTPPACPRVKHWSSTIDFFWADGAVDSVVTTQPCRGR